MPVSPLLLVTLAATAAVPDPYARGDAPAIGPAPVPVVEQAFWVQLKLDPATPVAVKPPEGLRLLDRTRPGPGRQWTRYYFRADRAMADARIEFAPEGRPAIAVPLRVLSYREDVEDKSRDLPGFTPEARKRGRSYFTDEVVSRGKARVPRYAACREHATGATMYDKMSDEELWQSLLSWNLPRQTYGNWPCPFCGERIYARNAFYPWNSAGRFRGRCPECERFFPTNDLAKDDFTSGDFPDDGWGWDSKGTGKREDACGWVGYAVERHWQSTGWRIQQLGIRYLFNDDRDAAHRAALLLARLAYVYPGMDMHWQQVLPTYLRVGKIEMDQQWDAGDIMVPALQAYDAIWDYLTTDQELVRFLHTKDPTINTPDDVRALIDTYLVQHVGLNFMRRWYHGDNGGWEGRVATVALLANMGGLSDAWVKELFTHAYNTAADQGGFQDSMFVNYLTREGPTNIGALGYSRISIHYMDSIAGALSRYPAGQWKAQCDIYDDRLYPRFRAALETFAGLRVAGQFLPAYGDHGNGTGWRGDLVKEDRPAYERAYRRWRSDALAWELFRLGKREPGLLDEEVWDAVEEHARRLGPQPPAQSRVFDGLGMAILESRSAEPDLKERSAIALRYGYGWGHSHHDSLNVEFWARGQEIVPDLGYPTWVHPLGSTGHGAHHVTGLIDRGDQYKGATGKGWLEGFAPAPEAGFVECAAHPTGFPARVYRRASALLDAPGRNSYVLDILRLQGGTTRTYAFHGPPHDDFQCGLAFGEKGAPLFGNVVEPQQAASDGDVVADWKYEKQPIHLRLTMLARAGRRYVTARFGKVDAPPIRFLLAEEEASEGASQFVALWEPYEGQPFIEKVEPLPVKAQAGAGGAFPPLAVRVTLAGGQTDTLLYAAPAEPSTGQRVNESTDRSARSVGSDRSDRSAGAPLTHCLIGQPGPLTDFRGSFGYLSQVKGEPRCLHLAGGDRLLRAGFGVAAATPAYRARIVSVDFREGRLVLDRRLPAGGCLDGIRMQITAGGKHRVSYRIARVLPPGNVVQIDMPAKVFQSKLEGVGQEPNVIRCEIAPPTEVVRSFPPGYYDGALLTDESLKARYRVARVDGDKILVDRPAKETDFAATDPYGRRMVHVFDFGEGDEVAIPTSVFLRREAPGRWQLRTTTDVRLVLPAAWVGGRAGKVGYRGADGKSRNLAGTPGPGGSLSFSLKLAQIGAGRTELSFGR